MSTQPGSERYPHVFQPLDLGPVTVPNRIYMSPHGIPLQAPVPGLEGYSLPSQNRAAYFGERARGGVGLIVHSTLCAPFAAQDNISEAATKEAIPAYAAVADAVHEHGAKIMAEIWYVNWLPKRWEQLGPEAPGLAPSATQNLLSPTTRREMTKYEIQRVQEGFVEATVNLREAGYDGVQLHMSHGAIGEYFLSPYHNQRTDEYGGSLENRMRFMVETLRAMRDALGPDLALSIRQNSDQLLQGGYGEDDVKQVVGILVDQGLLDFVDLDISVEPEQLHLMTTGMFDPVMHNAERVGRISAAIEGIPVIATPGRVTTVVQAERLIAGGTADMIGMVRGLIAEPFMVKNALEGKERESKRCIAVNACVDMFGVGWGCAVNPSAAREERWGNALTAPAPTKQKVVVVGGGPAGLEAARIAALRGHTVTLLERGSALGGGVALWAALPGREVMGGLPTYFRDQLPALGVDVRLDTTADADTVLALEPDAVVIATGSRYRRDGSNAAAPRPLPGHDGANVHGPEEIIRGDVKLSGKVVVIDDEGYHTASGVAELLAAGGAQVELVSRRGTAGASLGLAIGYVVGRLLAAGVVLHDGFMATSVADGKVELFHALRQQPVTIEGVDHVVLATMREAVFDLQEPLEGQVPYVYLVGDALAPRNLRVATYEGHRFGRAIGEPDAPKTTSEELFRVNHWHQVPAA
jgi:2,4-dienoyl-CoA reductase-like NADH-dependent reductase (Old Yellow Enzyme family)